MRRLVLDKISPASKRRAVPLRQLGLPVAWRNLRIIPGLNARIFAQTVAVTVSTLTG